MIGGIFIGIVLAVVAGAVIVVVYRQGLARGLEEASKKEDAES